MRTIKKHQVVRILGLLIFSGILLLIVQLGTQAIIEENLDHAGGFVVLPADGSIFSTMQTASGERLWWWTNPAHADYDEILALVIKTAEVTGRPTETELPQRLRLVWRELRPTLMPREQIYTELSIQGWPFRCFYGGAALPTSGIDFATCNSIILDDQPWNTPLRGGWLVVYGVIWPGLLANYALTIVVFGLVVSMTKFGWRAIIGRIRQRQGSCRECGYDLRGQGASSGCPECGWNRTPGEKKTG